MLNLPGCIRTEEWTPEERDANSETPRQDPSLAAGVGGHQRPAQEAHRTATGSAGLPGAGLSQPPRSNETKLMHLQRCKTCFRLCSIGHFFLSQTNCTGSPWYVTLHFKSY